MAITQQASKLRPNEAYNSGSSGIRTTYLKVEFKDAFNKVQHLIGSKNSSGTPGTYKVQFAVTDTLAIDTVSNAYLPVRAGVTYNDKSAFGWKDATFGGAASKQIGLAPNQSNNSVIHMSTDVMDLASIARADGKPGGILLVKITQTDPSGNFYVASGSSNPWDQARGKFPWFTEWYTKSVNSDAIADLTKLPAGAPYNEGYEFPGFPVVTNTAATLPTGLVMFTGDSRKCSAFMTYGYAAPARMAAMGLSTIDRPISTVNASGSGHNQGQYLAIALDMLNAGVRPTLIHIPGFSQNGFTNFATFKANNDNFMAAARAIPGLENVKFVIDTDYWVGGYAVGTSAENGRRECVAYAKSLANGTTVFCFDSDAIITDYSNPGATAFKSAYFTSPNFIGGDGVHAGPLGLDAMAYGDGTTPGLQSVYRTALGMDAPVADTTAPAMTGSIAVSGQTSSGFTLNWLAATDNVGVTEYELDGGSGTFVSVGTALTATVTGKTAATPYTVRVRARDAAGNYATPLAATATTAAAADTTAPLMTGAIAVSGQTSSGFTLTWPAATDAIGVTSYEVDNGSGAFVSVATSLTLIVTGKSAAATHTVRVRAKDAAGNYATPLTTTATTLPAADTTAPVMNGDITVSAITMSGATLSCQAATDAVGVAGYEYSIDGGASYTVIANAARSVVVSGRPAGTLHESRMRAFDAAGNRSQQPLAKSFTTLAEQPAQNVVLASTVAESRRVAFPGGTRVVKFGTVPSARLPNAPYLETGRWWSEKHPLDERYWVADITIDLAERGTTAKEVVALVAGVTVIEEPVIQGKLIAVKLGGFNASIGASNFCTLRITLANGERIDRTTWFKQQVGVYLLDKDPDEQSYFVGDIGHDLVDSNTSATQVKALPVGVEELVPAVIQGPLILVKLGGMDTLPAGANYCDFRIDCANSERFYRTIQFNRVDN
jgi:hypothetical protein